MESLESFVLSADEATTTQELRQNFTKFIKRFDIEYFSYLRAIVNLRSVPIEMSPIWTNAPQAWLDSYTSEFFEVDPGAKLAWQYGRPFRGTEIRHLTRLTPEQKEYLRALDALNILDGIIIPVFGPRINISYFSLATTERIFDPSKEDIRILQLGCQFTHLKYSSLSETEPPKQDVRLSRRETEVMSLVANGLSNIAIAKELGVSENTVDTMLRRAFKKLEVNNRISAVVKAIGASLILP